MTTAISPAKAETTVRSGDSAAVAEAAGQLLEQLSQLPANQIHEYPDSNSWAANGTAVNGGGALLGGDPHLPQTLPSVWYEVALSAPGYQATGVTVPGVPGVLLGHNAHIAWSLTDTQNEATLYYAEKVRGDEYYWRGAWRRMTVVRYTIPVRGGATVHLAVDITVHGPIMTQAGQRMAVDWMGNVPSDDLGALIGINQASDWTEFKSALAGWRAPTQNFTYADNDPVTGKSSGQTGNIGVYAAGYYPQVPSGCQPWLPMPGSGQCDISGVIPYNAIPQVHDPPSHVVATDNQRPVAADYPYYSREFPSVTGDNGLGYGPRPAGGDPFTEDAADGGMTATTGPSWRMVATLNPAGVSAEGVYPGGQSDNPASPSYANLVPLWWDGRYLPVPAPGSVGGEAEWTLHG